MFLSSGREMPNTRWNLRLIMSTVGLSTDSWSNVSFSPNEYAGTNDEPGIQTPHDEHAQEPTIVQYGKDVHTAAAATAATTTTTTTATTTTTKKKQQQQQQQQQRNLDAPVWRPSRTKPNRLRNTTTFCFGLAYSASVAPPGTSSNENLRSSRRRAQYLSRATNAHTTQTWPRIRM